MPEPGFACGSSLVGYLNVWTGFNTGEQEGLAGGAGGICIRDSDAEPDPMERIERWIALDPGGWIELKKDFENFLDTKKKGRYCIEVTYRPPQLLHRKALDDAGISYPTQNTSSNLLNFVVDQDEPARP